MHISPQDLAYFDVNALSTIQKSGFILVSILHSELSQLHSAVHNEEHINNKHKSKKDAEKQVESSCSAICSCRNSHKVGKDTAQENNRQRDQSGFNDMAYQLNSGSIIRE